MKKVWTLEFGQTTVESFGKNGRLMLMWKDGWMDGWWMVDGSYGIR